jgi:hypothetical protein
MLETLTISRQMRHKQRNLIRSNAPKHLNLNTRANVKALASVGSVPRFEVVAYTGGLLRLDNLPLPVVIDLADTVIAPRIPALFNHNSEDIVGHHENVEIVLPATIKSIAVISGTSDRANEVKDTANNGFPWNVSVGIDSQSLIEINAGNSVSVNGSSFDGPIYLARKNTLREISFVPMGADAMAFARLVASYGAKAMTFEEWLASLGLDPNALSDPEKALAKKIYDALMAASQASANDGSGDGNTNGSTNAASGTTNANSSTNVNGSTTPAVNINGQTVTPDNVGTFLTDTFATLRTQAAAEHQRIDRINLLNGQYSRPVTNGRSIAEQAIADNWTVERTELAMLRASRPTDIHAGGRSGSSNDPSTYIILAASLAIAGKLNNPEKHFTPQILDTAHKKYKGRIGLQQFLLEAAYANGYTGSTNVKVNLRQVLQAAFSTIDIPNILVTNQNKYLIDGYSAVDDSWRELSAIGSVPDFKEQAGYRGVGSFTFDPVAPTGHIPHGAVSEVAYGNKADTYGKMFAISRQNIINDDMSFLTSIPRGMGRGGALALIKYFWTEFMDNSTFFVAGNNNTSTGAFGITGLGNALAKFRKQTDENGDYVFANPAYVVVPPELEDAADQLYNDTQLITGENLTRTASNPYAGKFKPIVSPYLSDSRFIGNSTTAYYLIADPNDIPVIEVVFLDGVETPTVESADVDFSQLGIQFRGYFDFGVRLQDFRGGVRSTGV